MPSALCYEQIAVGQWSEYFCLVNPTCQVENEDEASATAEAPMLPVGAGLGEADRADPLAHDQCTTSARPVHD